MQLGRVPALAGTLRCRHEVAPIPNEWSLQSTLGQFSPLLRGNGHCRSLSLRLLNKLSSVVRSRRDARQVAIHESDRAEFDRVVVPLQATGACLGTGSRSQFPGSGLRRLAPPARGAGSTTQVPDRQNEAIALPFQYVAPAENGNTTHNRVVAGSNPGAATTQSPARSLRTCRAVNSRLARFERKSTSAATMW